MQPIQVCIDKKSSMDRKSFFQQFSSGRGESMPEQVSGQVVTAPATLQKGRLQQVNTAAAKGRLSTGVTPYTGTFTEDQLRHLLRRTLFGFRKTEFDAFKGMTASQVVDLLLTTSTTAPVPPVNNYNSGNYTDPNVPAGSTWVNASFTDGTANALRNFSLKSWWMGLMLNQDATILEKMVLFWHNHFATEMDIVGDARYSYLTNAMLRKDAMGNVKTLVKDVTRDAGMLVYLNGYLNSKNAPDENYARELQELFTVGKGPNSKYTEDDVKAVARVLTGWRINRLAAPASAVYFDPTRHDTGNKTLSSFYGTSAVITGRSGTNAGNDELNDLVDLLFAQRETALHICRKLYRYFVYYDIDAQAENDVIAPLADTFINSGFEIKPVLSQLLKSEHFFDSLNQGCMIKSPVDHIVGFLRQWNVAFPASSNIPSQYGMWNDARAFCQIQGMDIGDPPSVAGWPAWYQVPSYYQLWINSDTFPKRNQFQDLLISTGYTSRSGKIIADVYTFAQQFPNPENADKLLDDSIKLLLAIPPDATMRALLKANLLPGGIPDFNWTDEWNQYKNNPGNTLFKNIVYTKLIMLYKSIMNLAEYQLS